MAKQRETVVGVFTDESYARRAIESLQSAGFNARVADESALNQLSDVARQEANVYLNRQREGNTVVMVDRAGNRGEDALNIMLENGAEYMNLHGGDTGRQMQGQSYDADYYQNLQANQRQYGRYDTNLGRARTDDEMRVQLREEKLVPTKQAVQAGEVEVRKTVHEEQREVPVDLKREEVYIDRREVDRPISGEVGDLEDETIRVPVYEEQAQLQKQGRVAEEVVIGKNVEQERETLTGTVRREDVDVVGADDAHIRGEVDVDRQTSQTGTTSYDRDR